MRELNQADIEVKDKIMELQLFVAEKLSRDELSDIIAGQLLIDDIQTIHHIWTKDKGSI